MNSPITGLPGIGNSRTSTPREMIAGNAQFIQYIPGLKAIDGTKAADPGNTDDLGNSLPTVLRGGLLMGKTSGNKYANAVLGLTTAALGGGQTTLTTSAAVATELARRIGASGTLNLTGPPTPGGVVRTLPIAFSAVNTTTGAITITADSAGAVSGANAVEAIPVVDSTGVGTFTLTIEGITTGAITYSSTAATLVTNINTALNSAFGTSAIVASGASLAALILTFSGTGYTNRPINGHVTSVITIGSGSFTINGVVGTAGTPGVSTTTTAGVVAVLAQGGEFIAGSFIQDNDGSQTILTVLGNRNGGLKVTDADGVRVDQVTGELLLDAYLRTANLIPWPTDTAMVTYVKAALNANGHFAFDAAF